MGYIGGEPTSLEQSCPTQEVSVWVSLHAIVASRISSRRRKGIVLGTTSALDPGSNLVINPPIYLKQKRQYLRHVVSPLTLCYFDLTD